MTPNINLNHFSALMVSFRQNDSKKVTVHDELAMIQLFDRECDDKELLILITLSKAASNAQDLPRFWIACGTPRLAARSLTDYLLHYGIHHSVRKEIESVVKHDIELCEKVIDIADEIDHAFSEYEAKETWRVYNMMRRFIDTGIIDGTDKSRLKEKMPEPYRIELLAEINTMREQNAAVMGADSIVGSIHQFNVYQITQALDFLTECVHRMKTREDYIAINDRLDEVRRIRHPRNLNMYRKY